MTPGAYLITTAYCFIILGILDYLIPRYIDRWKYFKIIRSDRARRKRRDIVAALERGDEARRQADLATEIKPLDYSYGKPAPDSYEKPAPDPYSSDANRTDPYAEAAEERARAYSASLAAACADSEAARVWTAADAPRAKPEATPYTGDRAYQRSQDPSGWFTRPL